jgi:protein TonB
MFEQSVISSAPKGKRVWTTCLGVTGQVVLVTGMVMAPMLWPQVLPPASFTLIVPGPPPGPAQKAKGSAKPQSGHARRRVFKESDLIAAPSVIPNKLPPRILDDPDPGVGPFVPGSTGGPGGGTGSSFFDGVIGGTGEPPKVERAPAVKVEPTPVATVKVSEPTRVRVGGVIKPPRLVRRVDPIYPDIAKKARVSGVVKLSGVIAVDGHVKELSVESGNVLLVRAALEAVAKWVYEPTQLNGDPVEVATTILVTFTLNQ